MFQLICRDESFHTSSQVSVGFGPLVIEDSFQSIDTIWSSGGNTSYLDANVENLVLTETANINGTDNKLSLGLKKLSYFKKIV